VEVRSVAPGGYIFEILAKSQRNKARRGWVQTCAQVQMSMMKYMIAPISKAAQAP
jgi:hypothetical protein